MRNGEIVKIYSHQEPLEREARALTLLSNAGLKAPALLEKDTDALMLKMEYIPGDTYVEHVEAMTPQKARALAKWILEFQRITGCLKGDVNLRNFLWTGETCVGLDFEEPFRKGEPEVDMGKILAFSATYNPPFTQGKVHCGNILLKAFLDAGGSINRIHKAFEDEIVAISARRKKAHTETVEALEFWRYLSIPPQTLSTLSEVK